MMNSQRSTNMNIVRDKNLLKRRIAYFIKSGRGGRENETALINALSEKARLYVFGGLIRDISLYSAYHFCSDIDLVFEGSKKQLYQALSDYGLQDVHENKFGGFRVKDFAVDIDVWSFEETWAFKNQFISPQNIESLLYTTLMSWDSVLYDIQNNQIITTDSWLTDIHRGKLDVVLEYTPNVSGSLMRILRTIYGKNVLILGEKLCHFLAESLGYYSDRELVSNENEHFKTLCINSIKLGKLRKELEQWSGNGELKINRHLYAKQLELFPSINNEKMR